VIVPTAVNFKMKFPEFANIPDASVEFAIEEACRWVDDTWLVNDQTLAILYLAAHMLMVSIMRAQSATGQVISSERMGEISVTYLATQLPTQSRFSSDLLTTLYGTRYLEMAHVNIPAIAII